MNPATCYQLAQAHYADRRRQAQRDTQAGATRPARRQHARYLVPGLAAAVLSTPRPVTRPTPCGQPTAPPPAA